MTPQLYQRVRELYLAAGELPAGARPEWLEGQCAGDSELLAEVHSLLSHHDEQTDVQDDSHLEVARELLGDRLSVGGGSGGDGSDAGFPQKVGHYHIVRQIGEGGMGIVYEAEQERPRRRVALKLVRMGFGSESMRRRFQREAEMLGRLRHPGIAHIYESGIHTAPSGAKVPFLAMELIRGVSLTNYAQVQKLGVRDRLALFARVCDAVEHAHLNGVIHRDLKPTNVLVEAGGQPKILDFGIARATDADVHTATLHTSVGQLIGTVSYMSPEQASGHSADLDHRSDVYSLGIMLYELLTGRFPYDLRHRSIPDAVRVIQGSEPTRLSTVDRGLGGDIETIISKALEKERERRYDSAAAFAGDIRRFLKHEPIVARPTTTWYQVRKFAQRHRTLVVATVFCVLVLIGGIAGTTAGWLSARDANRLLNRAVFEATRQRDRAVESESRAATELARSRQTSDFMRSMLRSVNPSVARDRDTTLLHELLEGAVRKMDRGDIADQPSVEAQMRATLAETFMGIGDNAAARRVIEPAMSLARVAPAEHIHEFQTARIFYATTLVVWGRHTEAKAEFEQCMTIQQGGALPENEAAGVLYSNYAGLLSTLGDYERALQLNRRALDIRRRDLGERHGDVAASLANIAGCLKDLERRDEALVMMNDALALYRELEPPGLLQITILQNNIADLLLLMNRPDEAEARIREALSIGARIYKPEHQQMGILAHTLGRALRAQENHAGAYEQFAQAEAVLTAAFDHAHPFVVMTRTDLGLELTSLGRYREAEQELLAAHALLAEMKDRPVEALPECVAAIVKLYERWHDDEPDQDHLSRAAPWRARLPGAELEHAAVPRNRNGPNGAAPR